MDKINPELKVAISIGEGNISDNIEFTDGYNEQQGVYEIIVKYNGNLDEIGKMYEVETYNLGFGYAILRTGINKIEEISYDYRIIYVDKPRNFYNDNLIYTNDLFIKTLAPDDNNIKKEIPINNYEIINDVNENNNVENNNVQDNKLSSNEIIIGVIDSGIDIYNDIFSIFIDGSRESVLYEVYDQNNEIIYNHEDLNRLINEGERNILLDNSGHGTAVCSIILDNLNNVKYKLVVVRLKNIKKYDEPNTNEILKAFNYIVALSDNLNSPAIINLSYGNNYGDHNGGSILEQYIDSIISNKKINIVTGMGNNANLRRHNKTALEYGLNSISLTIGGFLSALPIQMWKNNSDKLIIDLITPDNIKIGPLNFEEKVSEIRVENYIIYTSIGISPFSIYEEYYIFLISKENYLKSGTWKISIEADVLYNGIVNVWLPSNPDLSLDTGFILPDFNTTMTIPGSSSYVISVGAYNSNTLNYAPFSGRGYTVSNSVKPDVSAPGVNVKATLPGNVVGYASGTSFATPYITAICAKLMYDGIILGNDPYMYGQRLKTKLIEMSKRIPGENIYPNEKIGWGIL